MKLVSGESVINKAYPKNFFLLQITVFFCNLFIGFNIVTAHCTALHCIALHGTARNCTELHGTALHCTVLLGTARHCSALHCTALHCTEFHCTALNCTALHCTAIHYSTKICFLLKLYILQGFKRSHKVLYPIRT